MTRNNMKISEFAMELVRELRDARSDYRSGKLGIEQANTYIGLFNASSRAVNTTVTAQRWEKEQTSKESKK